MKNQYFGDIIDLFKFDLLATLSKELAIDGITFVPMLTENDKTTEGSKRNYEKAKGGTNNTGLINFFKKYDDIKERNVADIQKYFDAINIPFNYFYEGDFDYRKRNEYFERISNVTYTNQLLFFDPDNGLEVKQNKQKHILYEEIKKSLNAVCCNSIVSVIQFKPRFKSWDDVILDKKNNIKSLVSPHVTCIANNNIAFFFMTKSKSRLDNIQDFLREYKMIYPFLMVE